MRDPRPTLQAARRSTRRGLRTVCSPAGLRGAGTELAWITAHLALYPLGIGADKAKGIAREDQGRFSLADLPPVQRGLLMGDVVAAGTPILLVHGLVDNRSIFTLLRRALRRREETGYERVHVIGHSLGGIVARYYVQRMGGDRRVHTLCTLGSPHAGTYAAKLWPGGVVRQLRPGSELMQELAAPAAGCRTRFVAFWSDLDQLIVPQRSAALDHPDLAARNVALRGVGHMSLPISGQVVHEIATLLAHLDEDGRTQTPGVTTLTPIDPAPASAPRARAPQARGAAPA